MTTNNLKGIAWDIFSLDWGQRLAIRRLDIIRDRYGQPVGPNDIFASDEAAKEFVEVMAGHGDPECKLALEMVRQFEKDGHSGAFEERLNKLQDFIEGDATEWLYDPILIDPEIAREIAEYEEDVCQNGLELS